MRRHRGKVVDALLQNVAKIGEFNFPNIRMSEGYFSIEGRIHGCHDRAHCAAQMSDCNMEVS